MTHDPRNASPQEVPHDVNVFGGGGETGALMRSTDWAATPLGPVERWPKSLIHYVSMILELPSPAIIFWGPEQRQIYNDGYSFIMGPRHPQFFGAPYKECWPDTYPFIFPEMQKVLLHGERLKFEKAFFAVTRHGFYEEAYFTFTFSPIRDDEGTIAGIIQPISEVTETVLAERRAETLRRLVPRADSLDPLSDAISAFSENPKDTPFSLVYLWDEDRKQLALAASTKSVHGLDLSQFSPLALAVATDGVARHTNDVPERLGDVHIGPWEATTKDAYVLPLRRASSEAPRGAIVFGTSSALHFDEKYRGFLEVAAGQVANAVAGTSALRDAQERVEALAKLDRAKTAFFSNVSHEFRTPLTLMLGPTRDLLADGELNDHQRHQLDVLERNALRLQKLVNALLDFSRIEAGRAQASYELVDLAATTRDLASAFDSAITSAGIAYRVRLEPIPRDIYVDPDMWEKIVLNLLSNALKFTFEGEIEISLCLEDEMAVLRVKDTGIGVRKEDLSKLFERFQRVEGARSRTHEGSGIGLALVQELAKMHGGSVHAESEFGVGSTFTVRIPTGRAHLPKAYVAETRRGTRSSDGVAPFVQEAVRWTRGEGASSEPPHPTEKETEVATFDAPARVLLVDDNADMRDYVGRHLERHWRVEAVEDGEKALAAATQNPPDIVLTDVMMPNLNGFQLLQKLREDPRTRSVPVIMLSARSGEEARIEGLHAGADDYLVKPFSARELVARVSTHLQLARHRKQAEQAGANLAAMLEQAPVAISIREGADHRFTLVNERYCRQAMMTAPMLLGKTIREAFPQSKGTAFETAADDAYRAGKTTLMSEIEGWLQEPNGASRGHFFNLAIAPVRNADGIITGTMSVSTDVTEQVLTRRALEKARNDAEEANRAKDDFLAMLGHELRNPLSPILTALHLMRLRGSDTIVKEVNIIERQAQHLVRLVDDLLDVSRIALGKVTLAKESVEISEIIASAIETASPLIENGRHRLVANVAKHGLVVEADRGRMSQVIANLLTNAAKYTPAGGRITITATRENGWVVVSVEDTGSGIPSELVPKVFDLFVQARQTIDRSQGGLGLGLAIVKNLVKMHGGSVSVRSDGLGQGSTFTVMLPELSASPIAAHEPPRPTPLAQATPLRVLIVDDNEDAADMLAEALEPIGHTTAMANDGLQALRVAERFRPDVAFLDIGLPVMDGHELAQRLLASRPEGLLLVAVTGYGQDTDRERSRAAGFREHLTKPVDLDAIVRILGQHSKDK